MWVEVIKQSRYVTHIVDKQEDERKHFQHNADVILIQRRNKCQRPPQGYLIHVHGFAPELRGQ